MPKFNYFHGGEAEQFSFFRIPRTLISDERFHGLSTEAKLLYGLLLDRMGLSLRSGWLDEDDRVFIFYTLQEVQETLWCGHNKATRLFNDLEQFGLIERVRQGQGKPAKIYVKNFTEEESPEQAEDAKADLKTSEKSTCRLPVSKPLDCPKEAGIYTDKNYTDYSYTDLSINPPTPSAGQPEIERRDQREEIMRRIDTPLTKSPYYLAPCPARLRINASHRETHFFANTFQGGNPKANENSNTPNPGQQPQAIPLPTIHDLPDVYNMKPPKSGANPPPETQKSGAVAASMAFGSTQIPLVRGGVVAFS